MARPFEDRQRPEGWCDGVDAGVDASDETPQPMRRNCDRAGVADRQAEEVDPVAPAIGRIILGWKASRAECSPTLLC